MAVAFQSSGGTVFAASASNAAITVPLPATRPTGSVLLLIGWSQLISETIGTAPSGYTLLTGFPVSSATTSGGRIWVYARVATSSETAPTFACSSAATGNSGDLWGACIFSYSGVDTSGTLDQIIDATAGAGIRTNDAAGVNTCIFVVTGIPATTSMIISFLARFRDAVDTFTPTAGSSEREDAGSTVRSGAQFYLEDKVWDGTGSYTIVPSSVGISARYLAVTIPLKQATAAAAPIPDVGMALTVT